MTFLYIKLSELDRPSYPKQRVRTLNEYDEKDGREHGEDSEDLQMVLDEAISKIKAMVK